MTQHTRKGLVTRALSVLGASALAITGVFAFGGTAAFASDGDIVPTNTGSITVHKHVGAPSSTPGSGDEITGSGLNALGLGLEGVNFKLERVSYNGAPINLGTSAGWDHLPLTAAASDDSPYSLTTQDAIEPTSATGVITYSNLPLGLYLVTELPGTPGVVAVADPFLVSVPSRAATSSTWNYNVHVYPKNRLADLPTKTVSNPDANNVVTWTITTTVPQAAAGQTFTTDMTITDQLDPLLTNTTATVTKNGTAMAPNPAVVAGQLVTVTIPKANLITGDVYVVTVTTTVSGPGEISNTAVRHLDGSDVNIGPAQTNWGAVQVLKKETTTGATLEGAKFELWNADKTVKVLDEQSTNASGLLTFAHVWLGNGTTVTKDFCLKETVAPAGHSISNEWTCVTLNAANTGVIQQQVNNPKRDTPNLPLTGSAGTAAFMAGGLGLLLSAAGIALVVTRRNTRSKTL